jgi:hypothetical protein
MNMSMPALALVVAGQLIDGVVVGDQEPVEAHAGFQDVREQLCAAGRLGAVPAVVGRHDRRDARVDRADVALQVDVAKVGLGQLRVALIEIAMILDRRARAERRPAVAGEVLRAGGDARRACKIRCL